MSKKLKALRALLAKVEAGKPDLSFSLGKHVDAWPDDMWNGDTITLNTIGHAYEGSLDAAKALHEAVLRRHGSMVMLSGLVEVWPSSRLDVPFWGVSEANPARAWLLAILKALIAEEEA